jgi:hypothetical protein
MANSFANEWLNATQSKFNVNRICLTSKVVVTILKFLCLELMASTSWLLGIPM